MPSLAFTTTSASTVVSSADLNVPTTNTSDVGGTTNAGGTLTFISSYTTSSELVTNKIDPASSWTVDELKILGVILWLVLIVTLIGNLACFYAVIKNLKVYSCHHFMSVSIRRTWLILRNYILWLVFSYLEVGINFVRGFILDVKHYSLSGIASTPLLPIEYVLCVPFLR